MERSDYEAQAQEFLDRYGFKITAAFKGDRCPPWDDDKHIHGDRYRVTIRRQGNLQETPDARWMPRTISFDFWNSKADQQNNKRPTAYDILACISSDVSLPTDPDEVAEEFGGDMKPSMAIAVAKFAQRLQAFFKEDEQESLAEIA